MISSVVYVFCVVFPPLIVYALHATSPKSGRSVCKVDISKITPPASPPSKPLDLFPPHSDPKGKGKEDDFEVDWTEKLVKDPGASARRDESHAEGVETEHVRSSKGGGAHDTHQSTEFHRVQGGSCTTHNPACDDLPYAPHWTLTQGSRMNDLSNCREFYSLSLPPAERLFYKNRHSMDLLDDHIHAGVNFYATTHEIVREWQAMGEDTLEFEAAKRELAEEREAFNAEKKGLLWRVADGEDKLAKEKQYNADRQKEWESACERSNRELKAARDEVIRLKGEKTKLSDEHEQAVAMYQKRENEYTQCNAMLEKIAAEKTVESKASEILAEEASADCQWLLALGVPLIADRIVKSDELANYMFELGGAAYNSGRKDGYGEGKAAAATNEMEYHFDLYKEDCTAAYAAKRREYEFLEFAIVKAVGKLSRKADAVETLKKAISEQDVEVGPSDQV
ncbi:hypothetical protein Hanom_Chr15g01367881 [Helianthus anomalus]